MQPRDHRPDDGRPWRYGCSEASARRRTRPDCRRRRLTWWACGPARSTAVPSASTCIPAPSERPSTLPAWQAAPCFTEPERAALALVEAATRLALYQVAVEFSEPVAI